jgi:ketosteroid isomerase-like protein
MEHLIFTPPKASAEVERTYRVTMVFRKENGQWRIIHRHADTQTSKEAPR